MGFDGLSLYSGGCSVIATRKYPTLLYGQSDFVKRWVSERIPDVEGQGFARGQGIGIISANGEKIIAGSVFTDWQPKFSTIQWHHAADNPMWARPHIVKAILAYPFIQLGVRKVWIAIANDNKLSYNSARHIGFEEEAELTHHFGFNRHAFILRMFSWEYQDIFGGISDVETRRPHPA